MHPTSETWDIDFGGPATYRIVVKGELGPEWSDRLGGVTVTTTEQTGDIPRTVLSGRIRDQAELNGILETLYSLHLPILRIEQVENDS